MNVCILDLETSKKPLLHPWHKDSYLSTIGLRMYLEDGSTYYKDWVWYHNDEPNITQDDRLQIIFEIQEEINKLGRSDLLVGHNIKFDVNWLKWYNLDVSNCTLWDTGIAEYMLVGQEKLGFSLNDCLERWELPLKTDKMKTYWDAGRNTHEIPLKKVVLPYMKNDIEQTAELFKLQYIKLKKNQALFRLCQVRQRCLHPLTDIEVNGMPFEWDLAKKWVDKFTYKLEIIDAELKSYFGRDDFNLNSGVDLSAGLFGGTIKRERYVPQMYSRYVQYKEPYQFTYQSGKKKGHTVTKYRNRRLVEICSRRRKETYEVSLKGVGFTPDKNTETAVEGVYQTNKGVLKNLKCTNKGSSTARLKKRVLDLLVQRSKIGKFTETFVGSKEGTGLFYNVALNSDGRAHPSYNQTVAATGRMSSSNPNGQNFPRSKEDEDGFSNPLKSVFVPSRPGGLILVIDLSQLEWRVAIWMSQDPVGMKEIFDGVDIHSDNAIKFFGDYKYRQAAKVMTFRLLYGGGAYAFFMDPNMPDFTLKKWNSIVDRYKRKYFTLTMWQEDNISTVGRYKGWLQGWLGRLWKFPLEPSKKHPGLMIYDEKKIKNYPVQGTATGDIVPLAMDLMWDKMNRAPVDYMSTNWMGTVHDSVLFDTMPHEVERVAKMGIEVFEELPTVIEKIWGCKFNLPLTGEAEWGKDYSVMTHSLKHEDGQWILKTKT